MEDVLSDGGSDPGYEDFFDPPREEVGGQDNFEGVRGTALRDMPVEGGREGLSAHEKRQLKVRLAGWLERQSPAMLLL